MLATAARNYSKSASEKQSSMSTLGREGEGKERKGKGKGRPFRASGRVGCFCQAFAHTAVHDGKGIVNFDGA